MGSGPGSCPECGQLLSVDAPRRLCLRCLMKLAALPEEQASQPVAALSLPRAFGDYELLEEIGRGGMGVVYRARQISLNRTVAVKILPGAIFGDPQFILRFREEVQMAAALKHPNIVTIHDVGEHDGQPYFAMEFVEGQTLAKLAAQRHSPALESARLIRRVAEAVHFAHENGILHRDLKPSNILLDHAGQPHLADFGLAKRLAANADLTFTGQTLGSPNYIPPEQVSKGRGIIGPHSDVYSLGAVLYHLLTGRPPFVADTVHDTLEAVLHDDPLAPRLLNPNVPRDLETICLKCLAKQAGQRYGSAQELADDLGRLLEHHPILARPVSPAARALKWMRRRPALASTIGITVASAMLISALTARHSTQLRHQRDQAVASERLVAQTLVRMEFNSALDQFKQNRSLSGMAQLAAIIHRDRHHAGATHRLASALTHRSFNLLAFAPLEHPDEVLDADYSPDGQTIVTACADGRVRLWNAQTGARLSSKIERPVAIRIVRFSPDGKLVLTAGQDGGICLWSLESGELIADPITNNSPVESASFNADGTLMLATFPDRTVRVWQVPSGRLLFAPIPHHDAVVVSEFNPAGGTLLTGSRDGKMQSWRLADGQPVGAVIETFRPLYAASFNPDGSRLASASGDRRPLIWEGASGKAIKVFDSLSAAVTAVSFSPDGLRLAAGTVDGAWMVADAMGRQRLSRLVDMAATIQSLTFSPDGERLLVATSDQTVQMFDPNGQPISDPIPHLAPIRKTRFNPDGTRVISIAGSNGCVWEVVRNLSPPLTLPHAAAVQTVRYSPDGLKLLTGGADGAARLWNARTGQLLAQPMRHIENIRIQSVRFSPDMRKIATASADRTARVWSAESGLPNTPVLPHGDMVLDAEFSPDGKRLVTASADDFVRVWNIASGTNDLSPLPHPADVLWAQFSPGGEKILTACADGKVRLWDAQTAQLLADGWSHGGAILSAEVSPDGRWLVTGAEDGTAIIGAADTGKPVGRSLWHPAPVVSVSFSSDSARFLTASSDGTMRLWYTSSHEPATPSLLFERSVKQACFVPGRQSGFAVVDRELVVPWSLEAGASSGESWRHWGSVHDLAVSPDGRFVATVGEPDRGILIRELPPVTVPAPEWLPALAEALAGRRLDEFENIQPVSPNELWRLQQRLRALSGDDEWSRWARWFMSVGDNRTLAPDLPVTRLEHADVCFRAASGYLHLEAARWAADQPRALARLATDTLLMATRSRHRAEADLLSRLALERAPQDSEVQRLRREVEAALARSGAKE